MRAKVIKSFMAISGNNDIIVSVRAKQRWAIYESGDTINIHRENVRIKLDKRTFHEHFEIL